jgi:DNA-binding protein Fis
MGRKSQYRVEEEDRNTDARMLATDLWRSRFREFMDQNPVPDCGINLSGVMHEVEEVFIEKTFNGNIAQSAKKLGLNRTTLHWKLQKLCLIGGINGNTTGGDQSNGS